MRVCIQLLAGICITRQLTGAQTQCDLRLQCAQTRVHKVRQVIFAPTKLLLMQDKQRLFFLLKQTKQTCLFILAWTRVLKPFNSLFEIVISR